jgi:Nif-specific regulatory protein
LAARTLYLTAKNQPRRGSAWRIRKEPLTIGRGGSCDVSIKDPLVSRRHCEIYLDNGEAFLKDLNSSNATFVNGEPCKEGPLRVGDEVAVGGAVFLVAGVHTTEEDDREEVNTGAPTRGLNVGVPVFANRDSDSLFRHGNPKSAEDLVGLFHLGRTFSHAGTADHLVQLFGEALETHFTPDIWGVVRCIEDNRKTYPAEAAALSEDNAGFRELLDQVLRDRKGAWLPQRLNDGPEITTTLLAPMVVGVEVLGAVFVQVATPRRLYEDGDLEYLIAMAHAAAPSLGALYTIARLRRDKKRLLTGTGAEALLVGDSKAIIAVRQAARQYAQSDLSVLVLGETGVGKELVARLIHEASPRAEGPLVVVNCAAIPDELFESEVFGHEAGAFTGAVGRRVGFFEQADGGTLFLDEVGDLSLPNQARLLRALESGAFRRLGGTADLQANVRVVAATNREMAAAVKDGTFRQDLYHRLNTLEIEVPPLRNRREDIAPLAEHFLEEAPRQNGESPRRFTSEALDMLTRREWPGNVRELKNVVARAGVLSKSGVVGPEFLLAGQSISEADETFPTLAEVERRHVLEAVGRCDGNMKAAAELLGIGRSTLYRKMAEYEEHYESN